MTTTPSSQIEVVTDLGDIVACGEVHVPGDHPMHCDSCSQRMPCEQRVAADSAAAGLALLAAMAGDVSRRKDALWNGGNPTFVNQDRNQECFFCGQHDLTHATDCAWLAEDKTRLPARHPDPVSAFRDVQGAMQVIGNGHMTELAAWCGGEFICDTEGVIGILVVTADGYQRFADEGEWIIDHGEGKFSVCTNEEFLAALNEHVAARRLGVSNG